MPGSFTTPTISATIAEGGSLTVTITPSSALGAATTVRWVIVPKGKTPISSNDFSSLTGTLSFTSGSNTAQTLTLTPTNDTALEVGETFELQLYQVVSGSDDIELATGMVTISDNDTGSFGGGVFGANAGGNIMSAASAQALTLNGLGGNDQYVVTRFQYGDVDITDGQGSNIVKFDFGVRITQVKEFATSGLLGTTINKVELTLSTGGVVSINSPAGGIGFQLGDGALIATYAAFKTALGVSGTGSSTGSVLTMANDYAVTGSASVTAPSQAGSISEVLGTTSLGDVSGFGHDADLSSNALGGNDQYVVTRFQYGDVDITDGQGSNIVKFDFGVRITQVKEFATSGLLGTTINKVELTLSTGAVVSINSPAGAFAFQLGDDQVISTYAAFKTALGATGNGSATGTVLTFTAKTIPFPSSGGGISGTVAAIEATLGDGVLAADIIGSGAFTVTGAGDSATYAIVKASDSSAVNWLSVDSDGNLRLADGAETVAPAGSHSLKLAITEDGTTTTSDAFTLNLGKVSYVGNPFAGLPFAGWSNLPMFVDIDHDGDLDFYSGPIKTSAPNTFPLEYHHNLLINGTTGTAGAWRKAKPLEDPLQKDAFTVDSTGGQHGVSYDVNGDGIMDLLRFRYYTGDSGQTLIADSKGGYTNIGNFWHDRPTTHTLPTPRPVKMDVDGDGDLDLVIGQSNNVYDPSINNPGMRVLRRDSTGETDQSVTVAAGDYLYGTVSNGIVTVTAHSTTQTGKVLLGRVNSNGNGLDKIGHNHPFSGQPDPNNPKYGNKYTWWLLGGADQIISGGVLRVKANMSLFTELTQSENPIYGVFSVDSTGNNPLQMAAGDIDGDGRREIVFTESRAGNPDVHLLKQYSTGGSAQSVVVSANEYYYGTVSNGVLTLGRYSSTQSDKVLLGKMNGAANGLESNVGTAYTRSLLSLDSGNVTLKANAMVFAEVTGNANPFDAIDAGNDARERMPNLLDLDRDGDLDLLITHENNGGTSIWWNTANGFSATNDAAKFTAQNDTLVGRANAKDVLTGGGGNDVFVLDLTVNGAGKYDVVTDFTSGDKIRVDTANGSEASVAAVKSAAKLSIVNNANYNTGETTNNSGAFDTVITYLGADGVAGGSGNNADYVVMVLEDYSTALSITNFDIV